MIQPNGPTFSEESVSFQGPSGSVAGTLALPIHAELRGVVLLLAGSGPIDRNGDAKALRTGVYRELAHAVNAQGFASLRYDKPGTGETPGDRLTLGLWDLVDYARAAVSYLRGRFPERPLILIGHSEGCVLGAAISAREHVEGLVMLAGPCESLEQTLTRQQTQAAEDLRRMRGIGGALVRALRVPERAQRKSKAAIDRILASDRDWIRISGVKLNAKWIREHCRHDATQDLRAVTCPVLAMTGSKDVQVLPEHAQRIAETVSGPAEWHIAQDLTHMLRRTQEPLNLMTLRKIYRKQCKEPVDAELLQRLTAWLDRHFPSVG